MPSPERQLSGCHVLIVDDRSDMCDILGAMLARDGATVAKAASPEEALAVLATRDRRPDVVVTDFSLLGARHDGAWLLNRIRATWSNAIAVIVVTGFTDRARELSRIGFDGVMFKPVNPQELCAMVARARQARRAQT